MPLVQHTYAEDCDFYVANHTSGNPFGNVWEKMDIFVIGHALGWFVKVCVL